MKNMKKFFCFVFLVIAILAMALPAFAGRIVTPNGGRAILWKTDTSTGSDYVAYISSGNSATLNSSVPSNNRYDVNAYGYDSQYNYGYYDGWINMEYYKN